VLISSDIEEDLDTRPPREAWGQTLSTSVEGPGEPGMLAQKPAFDHAQRFPFVITG
jgi:hypothetical protein